MTDQSTAHRTDFIRNIIDAQQAAGEHSAGLVFRFPPEPNGYLHIGHAKSICLNFGLAKQYGATCHLRFDDTNPQNDYARYVESIQRDVAWLGGEWGENLYYASDYFDQLCAYAVELIESGKAYVDSLSPEEIRAYRGTLTEPGKNSPYRDRSISENLSLFEAMKAGEFQAGEHCVRAKIDMSAGNINLRDPVIYRIIHAEHHRTGSQWCIYPMYDFSHALSDAIEGITHSLCTLEFQDHRELYNWFVDNTSVSAKPQQIEFSRLNLNYTVTSKRYLKRLVDEGLVDSWDDPRMPTVSGLRRRGFSARSIQHFCAQIGVSKQDSVIDMTLLEESLRDDLNRIAERRNAVLDPIRVVITNYPDSQVEWLTVPNHPQNPDFGTRDIPFSKELYIDRDDFMFEPPKKFFRLAPDKEVRLLNAYAIRCNEVFTDEEGRVTEIHATYDVDTLGGKKPKDGRKIKGVVHWVSASHAIDADVRLYDRLFDVESPLSGDDFTQHINSHSLAHRQAKVEPSLGDSPSGTSFQFNRLGYFITDEKDHKPGERLVFNQVVPLRSVW